jgi:hypothetical protein
LLVGSCCLCVLCLSIDAYCVCVWFVRCVVLLLFATLLSFVVTKIGGIAESNRRRGKEDGKQKRGKRRGATLRGETNGVEKKRGASRRGERKWGKRKWETEGNEKSGKTRGGIKRGRWQMIMIVIMIMAVMMPMDMINTYEFLLGSTNWYYGGGDDEGCTAPHPTEKTR